MYVHNFETAKEIQIIQIIKKNLLNLSLFVVF